MEVLKVKWEEGFDEENVYSTSMVGDFWIFDKRARYRDQPKIYSWESMPNGGEEKRESFTKYTPHCEAVSVLRRVSGEKWYNRRGPRLGGDDWEETTKS